MRSGPVSRGRDWNHRSRIEALATQALSQQENIKARVEAMKQRPVSLMDSAPAGVALQQRGISKPLGRPLRYARSSEAESSLVLSAGRPLVDTILDSARDRQDRAVLAWPRRQLANNKTIARLVNSRFGSIIAGIGPQALDKILV